MRHWEVWDPSIDWAQQHMLHQCRLHHKGNFYCLQSYLCVFGCWSICAFFQPEGSAIHQNFHWSVFLYVYYACSEHMHMHNLHAFIRLYLQTPIACIICLESWYGLCLCVRLVPFVKSRYHTFPPWVSCMLKSVHWVIGLCRLVSLIQEIDSHVCYMLLRAMLQTGERVLNVGCCL